MGCDGGSIPRRDEMVKLKKKAEKAEKGIELAAKWRYCALSEEELQQPIVSCELGRLYNKETVLMTLLDKTNIPDIAKHLRSLKDIVALQLTPNPTYKPSDKADSYNDMQTAEFICPLTGLHMNGQNRFVFFRQCGCVMSEKSLKEVPSTVCHKCGKPFVKDDVIIINGTEEEQEKQRQTMEDKREQTRIAKRKRKATVESSVTDQGSSVSESGNGITPSDPSSIVPTPTPSTIDHTSLLPPNGVSPVDTCSLPCEKKSKIVHEVKPKSSKLPKTTITTSTTTTTSTKRHTPLGNGGSPSKRKDLEKRDAYKSLFTSSVPPRPKEISSHWVTFFPYH